VGRGCIFILVIRARVAVGLGVLVVIYCDNWQRRKVKIGTGGVAFFLWGLGKSRG
jgi:hypothetical protein